MTTSINYEESGKKRSDFLLPKFVHIYINRICSPRSKYLYYIVYLVRKKEVNFILSCYTNLSHTGQEKFTSFFRIVYK